MAEIRWVDRDAETGKIKSHYARKQDWHKAKDFVEKDSAELVEFDAEMKAQQESAQKAAADKDALIVTLSTKLATLEGKVSVLEATAQKAAAEAALAELTTPTETEIK